MFSIFLHVRRKKPTLSSTPSSTPAEIYPNLFFIFAAFFFAMKRLMIFLLYHLIRIGTFVQCTVYRVQL